MSESSILARILAYVVENKIIAALEAESREMMVVEATMFEDVQANDIINLYQTIT